MKVFRSSALAAFAALCFASPVPAATPADTLVVADKIDDIVSLDPAESFEFSGRDTLDNVYDRLFRMLPAHDFRLEAGLAERWSVGDDGKTYTFDIRRGVRFHSGNPVTAADVAWSLGRAVKLDKTPSFILTQLGFTLENVDRMIDVSGPNQIRIVTDQVYAPSFLYNVLAATVASVIDQKTALEHERDGDMGHAWLKTHSAGSGPYELRWWRPNESIALVSPGEYWGGAVALPRVFVRHVPEAATARLLLIRGDVDLVRRMTPGDVLAISANPDLKVLGEQRGRIVYIAGNRKVAALRAPGVMEALKYLIDYDGMASTILKGQAIVHEAFLPAGFLGAIDDTPYSLDVAKARELLAAAGYPSGFHVTLYVRNDPTRIDIAQSIQHTMGQAGVTVQIKQATGAEVLNAYRGRTHELVLESWGPDYPDPQTNASAFAANTDNSDAAALGGVLAWRNAWPAARTTPMVDAAVHEADTRKREQMYEEMQRVWMKTSPFAAMFEEIEQVGLRRNVEGFSTGGAVGSAFYWTASKSAAR